MTYEEYLATLSPADRVFHAAPQPIHQSVGGGLFGGIADFIQNPSRPERDFMFGGLGNYARKTSQGQPTSAVENIFASMDMMPPGVDDLLSAGLFGLGVRGARKLPRMSRAEAEAAGYWHPIGDTKKLPMPFHEMTRQTRPARDMLDPQPLDVEAMQGGVLIPAPGDRSDVGKMLTHVNDIEFPEPVLLEGGHGFMRTHSPYGTVWASDQGGITKLNKQALKALEAGKEPYLAYMPMGYASMDFNTMMSDAVLEQIRGNEVSKTAKKEFDRKLRKLRPEWPGIDAEESIPMLESNGALRHAFMDTAQLDHFQRRGFPDLASTRKAITDPALYDVPNLFGGQSVARLSGDVVHDSIMPHKSYPVQIGGEYVGGLPEGVPANLLIPDFYAARRAAGKPESGDYYSLYRSNIAQPINQQWIDTIMDYLGRNPPVGPTSR